MSTAVGDRIRNALGVNPDGEPSKVARKHEAPTTSKRARLTREAVSSEPAPRAASAARTGGDRSQSPLWLPDPSGRGDKTLVRVLRVALVVVLVVLVLLGLRQLVLPHTTTTASRTSSTSFPLEQAGAVAARFARSYLALDAAGGDEARKARDGALALDAASDLDAGGSWNGIGQIDVLNVLPAGVQVSTDGRRGTATVLTSVKAADRTSWLALAVPVGLDGARVVVTGAPVFVGFPAAGDPTGDRAPVGPVGVSPDLAVTETDSALSESTLGTGTAFLKALAGDDAEVLAQASAPGARLAPLGGFVQLDSVTSWTVLTGNDTTRSAIATVVWREPSGGLFKQTYALTLAAVTSGTSTDWRVQQLTVNTTSSSSDVNSPEGETP